MDGCNDVDGFAKAVKKKLQIPNPIQEIFDSTTDGRPALRPGLALPALSSQPDYIVSDDETPLFVVVVDRSTMTRSRPSLESSLTEKPPHPKRKARWIQLNEILEENIKQSKTSDSTAYSYVSWSQVESILQTVPYV